MSSNNPQFKAGDLVAHEFKKGKIQSIGYGPYPLHVQFEDGTVENFTEDGRLFTVDPPVLVKLNSSNPEPSTEDVESPAVKKDPLEMIGLGTRIEFNVGDVVEFGGIYYTVKSKTGNQIVITTKSIPEGDIAQELLFLSDGRISQDFLKPMLTLVRRASNTVRVKKTITRFARVFRVGDWFDTQVYLTESAAQDAAKESLDTTVAITPVKIEFEVDEVIQDKAVS